MSRRCTTCTHPRVAFIHRDIVAGKSVNSTANRYGLDESSLHRHLKNHLPEEQRREIAVALKRERAETVAGELNEEKVEIKSGLARIIKELELILNRAKENGDDPLSIVALRETRTTLLDLAKVYGTLKNELTVKVDINTSPQWLALRAILIEVLDQHPAAKADFLARVHPLVTDGRPTS